MTNLNVNGNVNILNGRTIKTTGQGSFDSINIKKLAINGDYGSNPKYLKSNGSGSDLAWSTINYDTDLTNKPTTITNNSQLSNGANYIKADTTNTLTNKDLGHALEIKASNNSSFTPSNSSNYWEPFLVGYSPTGNVISNLSNINNHGGTQRAWCWAIEVTTGSGRALGLFTNTQHTWSAGANNTGSSSGWNLCGWFNSVNNGNAFSFTASHRCFSNDTLLYNDDKIGLIVQSTGTYDSLYIDNIEIDNAVPIVEICNKKKSKSVLGVIAKYEKDEDSREGMDFGFIQISKKDKNRLYINGIGEGGIWVCNTNGNFENGDYIQSSNVTGYGEKQDDDLLHNYSVGKITMDVDFNNIPTEFQQRMLDNGVIAVFVGCIYYCG
tara:strand:+ start:31 stop:1173 length:1143 start_codon:yes stop_codon:yes gene_type:complete